MDITQGTPPTLLHESVLLAAHRCAACGYDLSGTPTASGGQRTCPECGAPALNAIHAPHDQATLLRLAFSLLIWGIPLAGGAVIITAAARAWLTAAPFATDDLAFQRPMTALGFIPGMLVIGGTLLLAALLRADSWIFRIRYTIILIPAVALALLLAHRLIAPGNPTASGTPWILRPVHLKNFSLWALVLVAPLYAALLLDLLAAAGAHAGLPQIALACRRAAPVLIIALYILITAAIVLGQISSRQSAARFPFPPAPPNAISVRAGPGPGQATYVIAGQSKPVVVGPAPTWSARITRDLPLLFQALGYATLALLASCAWLIALILRTRFRVQPG